MFLSSKSGSFLFCVLFLRFTNKKVAIGDEGCREIITRSSQYEFREKLKEILLKPYDRKECNRRRLEASCRKPLEHDGERLDSDGKSYLDYYPGRLIHMCLFSEALQMPFLFPHTSSLLLIKL